jgi:chitin disaccharide deacetylase
VVGDQHTLPPGIIVNADDLGIHPDINSGILSAYRNGILTSCTMLMTTAYRDQTVRDYVRPALLPIGIHLSLTLGKAVAPRDQVPDLVDAQGHLRLTADRLLLASFRGRKGRDLVAQIGREFAAQLALARDLGLHPTHADSHQHVHMNPVIFSLVEGLLPRYGIGRLRYSRERLCADALGADFPALMRRNNPPKWALLRWRSAQLRPQLATTGDFFGILYSGAMTKRVLMRLIARAPAARSLEICIHPGFPAPSGEAFYPRPGYNEFISSDARRVEHDVLTDPDVKELIRRRGVILRAFDGRQKGEGRSG